MADPSDIAIVGMACVLPGAGTLEQYWANLRDGVDAVTDVPAGRWDPVFHDPAAVHAAEPPADRIYCRRGGFVDDLATFDPTAFGIMPVAVDGAEPDQMLALATTAAALADASGAHEHVAPERVGVVLGRGAYRTAGIARLDQRVHVAQQVVEALRSLVPDLDERQLDEVRTEFQERLGPARPDAAIGLVPNLAASRIANRLDFRGPAYTVDAACASSLIAVDQAVGELESGRCDLMLAGGVHHCHDLTLWSVFSQLRALSPSGCIRPFDREADGIIIGEGTGVVVLKRLADAERDGDRVYAVIRGTGVASDGRDTSLMSPGVEGQVAALEQAWTRSGLDPATVGLVEAHGTATPAGDEVELETLRRVFGKDDEHRATAVLGSVKSMIGHAMPAAGAAGLIKAALAVHHGVLLPTLHVDEPHPHLANTRFRLIDRAEPWADTGTTRRAAVDAFGFGGINSHVVLEQWQPSSGHRAHPRRATPAPVTGAGPTAVGATPPSPDGPAGELLRLAGRDAAHLRALLDDWEADPGAASVPGDGPARLAILRPDDRRLTLARKVLDRGEPWRGRNDLWFEPEGLLADDDARPGQPSGKLAFVFPGVEPTFEPRVDDVIERFGRGCAWERPGSTPLEQQGRGLIAVGRLLHAVLGDLGIRPDLIAGHSLGEWCGEMAAGMIPDDIIDTFIDRLRPGSIEVPDVSFLALGCGVDTAAALIDGVEGAVISHDNCPHQSVVCGPTDAMAVLQARARDRQVLAQELPFRSGFHSPMFAPFLPGLRRTLGSLALDAAQVPLWSATTCAPYPDEPDAILELATRHLVEPVRFRELVLRLHDEGVRVFVQVGVGSLTGFIDDTLRDHAHLAIAANTAKSPGLDQLTRVGAALWAEGLEPDLTLLGAPTVAPAVAPTGRPMALRLGTSLVRDLTPVTRGSQLVVPEGVAPDHPLLSEVRAIGDDVTAAAQAILGEWANHPSPRAGKVVADGRRSANASGRSLQPDPVPQPTSSPVAAPGSVLRALELSLEHQPAWADHAFFRQPADWPVPEDRFPLVPMTGIIEMLRALGEELDGTRVAVAIEDIRAFKWLRVDPPVTVAVKATVEDVAPDGTRRVRAAIDGHARATVVLADRFPPAPSATPVDLTEARAVSIAAADVYTQRWMFHGPAYQGIRRLDAVGTDGIAGGLESRPAPGALLDNAGQLIGIWMEETVDADRLALPVSIERIELFGPHPAPGTAVDCIVRVTELTPTMVHCDLELSVAGTVWARITDWVDRRFATTPEVFSMLRWPEREGVSVATTGGYLLARETWLDSASRDIMMRRYLTGDEQVDYEGHHPNAQRQFLLGRMAAKDAVRARLWDQGHGPLFPAEVEIGNEASGRPVVRAPGGGDLRVSIAHTTGLGVAIVGDGVDVGIDVEPVEERSERFAGMVLTDAEQALVAPTRFAGDRDAWLTAVWAAKEAVAKATGRGLQGRPKDIEVTGVDGDTLVVSGHPVHLDRIEHHEKEYVVAWTTDH
jgi:acyl transferase domain-containing protein/phosphopantetheinyl transferase (holo-ACP synthase)